MIVIGLLFGATHFFKNKDTGEVAEVKKGFVTGLVAERPHFLITSEGLKEVEVYAVPTGTNVTVDQYLSLGKTSEYTEIDGKQKWTVPIPVEPMLFANIFAVGMDNQGNSSDRFYFALSGASDIYSALWLDTLATVEELSVGQEIITNGLQVKFKKITDNRCPEGVQCITGGKVEVTLEVTGLGKKETIVINTDDKRYASAIGYKFSIEKVTPDALAGTDINDSDYRITLLIEQENKG